MREDDTHMNDIEPELRDLVLLAYADGKTVEGEWWLDTAPDEIPDWVVTIRRRQDDAEDVETRYGSRDE